MFSTFSPLLNCGTLYLLTLFLTHTLSSKGRGITTWRTNSTLFFPNRPDLDVVISVCDFLNKEEILKNVCLLFIWRLLTPMSLVQSRSENKNDWIKYLLGPALCIRGLHWLSCILWTLKNQETVFPMTLVRYWILKHQTKASTKTLIRNAKHFFFTYIFSYFYYH